MASSVFGMPSRGRKAMGQSAFGHKGLNFPTLFVGSDPKNNRQNVAFRRKRFLTVARGNPINKVGSVPKCGLNTVLNIPRKLVKMRFIFTADPFAQRRKCLNGLAM